MALWISIAATVESTPPDNPHIWEEPRFQNTDTRRITHWGITAQTGIPMAAPGKYQVRMTVDGQTFTQPFDVVKDPVVVASVADLQASTKLQIRLRDNINKTAEMVNQIELWRKQLEDQKKAKASDAAEALGITAHRLKALGLVDKIINEPVGGAHRDPKHMATSLKRALVDALRQVSDLSTPDLLARRYERLKSYGRFTDTSAH